MASMTVDAVDGDALLRNAMRVDYQVRIHRQATGLGREPAIVVRVSISRCGGGGLWLRCRLDVRLREWYTRTMVQ